MVDHGIVECGGEKAVKKINNNENKKYESQPGKRHINFYIFYKTDVFKKQHIACKEYNNKKGDIKESDACSQKGNKRYQTKSQYNPDNYIFKNDLCWIFFQE